MNKATKQTIVGLLMVIPSFLLLFGLVIIPIIESINVSFHTKDGLFTFANYESLFKQKALRNNILFTIHLSVISTLLVLVISLFLGIYLRFEKGAMANWIRKLYYIPLFIPSVIGSYGLINMYGNHGWLASFLQLFTDSPFPRIIYDANGIILAFLWFNIPFATMLISSALSGIPSSVIESARDVGAGRIQVLFKIILPMCSKTVLVAATFVFISLIGSFTAPFLIGPNAPQMLGVAMQQIFTTYLDVNLAAALSVVMFLICSVMGYFYIRSMVQDETAR